MAFIRSLLYAVIFYPATFVWVLAGLSATLVGRRPTLAVVLNLAVQDNAATAGRGAFLTFIYCLGLGIPFIITGLAFRHALGAFAVIKRHYGVVVWTGGLLLIAVGVLLLTGTWNTIANDLRGSVSGYTSPV